MLIIYKPDDVADALCINVHDTVQNRTFYTDEAALEINMEDIAGRLDDFVGLGKKKKSQLVIHNLTDSVYIEPWLKAFKAY